MSLLPIKCLARKNGSSPFHLSYNATTDDLTISINGSTVNDNYFNSCITIKPNELALYHRYTVVAIANGMMFMDFTETSGSSYILGQFMDKFYYSVMNKDLNDIVIYKTETEVFVMPRYAATIVDNTFTQTTLNASYNSIVSNFTEDPFGAQKFLDESARIDKEMYYAQWFKTWERLDYMDVQNDLTVKLLSKMLTKFPDVKTALETENPELCTLFSKCCSGSNDIDTSVPTTIQTNLIEGNKTSHRSWQRGYWNMWDASPVGEEQAPVYEKHPLDTYELDITKFYREDSLL